MDRLKPAVEFTLHKLGYTNLRNNQMDVIKHYADGNDVFFCSPTGSGKSLVFEVAPFVHQYLEGKTDQCVCIVISPLSALMKSQVQRLIHKGINAVYLKEGESDEVMLGIKTGKYELVFASPETLLQSARYIISHLSQRNFLKTIFVDEANCIKKFGKGEQNQVAYRPYYGSLGDIRSLAGPTVPVVALTATASAAVKDVIMKDLCMSKTSFQLTVNPNKPNIKYWVFNSNRTRADIARDFDWLVDMLKRHGKETPRMIIFFRKIEHIADVFEHLETSLGRHGYIEFDTKKINDDRNRLFDMYYLKTDEEVKESIAKSYDDPNGHTRVVLCSTSFSMGLDVKGVNTIVHYGACNDLDDYLQESGRAGRNPEGECHAIVIKYKGCLSSQRISQEMKEFLKTNGCRRSILLKPFTNEQVQSEILHICCDNCTLLCKCKCSCKSRKECSCAIKCEENDSVIYGRMKYFQHTNRSIDDTDSSYEGYSSDSDFEGHRLRRPQ